MKVLSIILLFLCFSLFGNSDKGNIRLFTNGSDTVIVSKSDTIYESLKLTSEAPTVFIKSSDDSSVYSLSGIIQTVEIDEITDTLPSSFEVYAYNTSITNDIEIKGTGNVTVYWGDGDSTILAVNTSTNTTFNHAYSSVGYYTLKFNGYSNITSIDFSSNSSTVLIGDIGAQIRYFTNLEYLDISGTVHHTYRFNTEVLTQDSINVILANLNFDRNIDTLIAPRKGLIDLSDNTFSSVNWEAVLSSSWEKMDFSSTNIGTIDATEITISSNTNYIDLSDNSSLSWNPEDIVGDSVGDYIDFYHANIPIDYAMGSLPFIPKIRNVDLSNNAFVSRNFISWGNQIGMFFVSADFSDNTTLTGKNNFIDNLFDRRYEQDTSIMKTFDIDNTGGAFSGPYQLGDLGTYTGDENDLTPAQVDNLVDGTDYDGNGTNTVWSSHERLWWMVNAETSSTNTTPRLKWIFIYSTDNFIFMWLLISLLLKRQNNIFKL